VAERLAGRKRPHDARGQCWGERKHEAFAVPDALEKFARHLGGADKLHLETELTRQQTLIEAVIEGWGQCVDDALAPGQTEIIADSCRAEDSIIAARHDAFGVARRPGRTEDDGTFDAFTETGSH